MEALSANEANSVAALEDKNRAIAATSSIVTLRRREILSRY